jgi:predicted transcriptional regulator
MANTTDKNTTEERQRVGVRKKRWIVCFEHAILDMDLSIYEKMVYIVLCSHAKKDGPAFPCVMTIAQEASCSRTKVFEALNTLEELGIITRENRIFPKRGQSSNLYEIEDIDDMRSSPQCEPGSDVPSSPSVTRTPVSVSGTAIVRHTDGPLNVLEQDPFNRVIEQKDKENTPLTPRGEHTDILDSEEPGSEEQKRSKDAKEPQGPETTTQGAKRPGEFEIEPLERKLISPTRPAQIGAYRDPVSNIAPPVEPVKHIEPTSPEPGSLIEAILAAYNKILPELPAASRITRSREKTVNRRIREEPERSDPGWWEKYFARVREFPWLMGQNPSNWRACLDWLIGERGMLKVLEGGFGRSSPPKAGCTTGRTAEGVALQRKYTNEEGKVDVWGLMRELDELDKLETAGMA